MKANERQKNKMANFHTPTRNRLLVPATLTAFVLLGTAARAQDAKQIVQEAVNAELAANRTDHSHWRYLEREEGGNEYVVVDTENGTIRRHVLEDGHAPSPQTLKADDDTIQRFIHDPSLQAKQRHDGAHDDKSATELTIEMPTAFSWKLESETPENYTLSYHPNPDFSPPDMESRVMGGMSGTLVVSKNGHRIRTFSGRLMNDVTIGFGFLARLKAGSTFDVERRIVGDGYWQITDTHVHINGHALFFKTISTQEDEVKSKFHRIPDHTTLDEAARLILEPLD